MNWVLQTGAQEITTMTKTEAANATGNAAVTPQGAAAAPAPSKATTKASQKKGAPKSARGGKPAATKTAPAPKPAKPAAKASQPVAREGSKKSVVLELLRRKDGATGAEIAKITKWQPHTIRGFISGTVSKKMKLAVESTKNEQGERVYKVK
jgi:hypothetical protein